MAKDPKDILREAALAYHDAGYFVIPCAAGTKRPLVKWGPKEKRLTKKALAKFWDSETADIAIRLDDKTLVLDLDPKHEPRVTEVFAELEGETRCARTPSGGLHAWFLLDDPMRPLTYKGMDVLTRGRIVVVPPSSGRHWTGTQEVRKVNTAQARVAIDRVIEVAGITGLAAADNLARDALDSLDLIPYHRRNQTLTAVAGLLRKVGLRGNRLEAAIEGMARGVTENPPGDPMTMDEIIRICESIDWRTPQPFETRDFVRYEFNTADEPPGLHWLIRDFLPSEGVTSLFGMGKQGKSYIAMEVFRALATPTDFLGLEVPDRQTRVLYVDWEKRGNSLKRRLHALASESKLVVEVIEPHGALVNMVESLQAQVAVSGYELVIIDSLTIAIMQGDVNEASTVVPAMFALNSLGCPVLALDHTRKPMSGEPYETLSAFGSVFKGNVCSMNWRLKKVSGDENGLNVVLQHISNNYDVDPPDIHARINFVFNELGALDAATVERTSLKAETEELWRFLSNQLEPLEATNIAVVLGMALYDVKRSLSRLEDKKLAAHTTENNRDYWVALQQEDDDD